MKSSNFQVPFQEKVISLKQKKGDKNENVKAIAGHFKESNKTIGIMKNKNESAGKNSSWVLKKSDHIANKI